MDRAQADHAANDRMSHLNIPLNHSLTTRRPRRVVWILVIASLAVAFLASGLWFTRPDIGLAAPEGTEAIIRLRPTKEDWGTVLNILGDWPVVSRHGLTLRELAPFIQGDLVFYVDQAGEWTTAIRSKSERLPHNLLDTNDIAVQEAGHDLFLLQDRAKPLLPISLKRPSFWLSTPLERTVGDVYLKQEGDWVVGRLQSSKTGWTLRLPKTQLARLPWKALPNGTVAALATPVLTNDENMSGVTGRMDAVLSYFNVPSMQKTAKDFLQNKGAYLLTSDVNGLGVLLSASQIFGDADIGKRLLTTASALQNPSIKRWVLPDSTTADELTADPSAVSIEERTLLGTQVYQAKNGSTTWAFAEQKGSFVLSNRESLLAFWLQGKSSDEIHSSCPTNGSVFLDLRSLFRVSSPSQTFETPNAARALSLSFEHMAIYRTLFSTEVKLCF